MKDNILCIFIMLFVSVTFNANAQKSPQGQFSVKGVLVDSLSNEGEPYSTIRISLKSNPAKPVKLAVTDTNGKFSERLVSPGIVQEHLWGQPFPDASAGRKALPG